MNAPSPRPSVVVGVLGKKLDKAPRSRWRPSVALGHAPDKVPALARLEEIVLVHEARDAQTAEAVARDIASVRKGIRVRPVKASYSDHYDYGAVYRFFDGLLEEERRGKRERDCFLHVTTGSPVVHAVLHDLASFGVAPAQILVTVEPPDPEADQVGDFRLLHDPSHYRESRAAARRVGAADYERLRAELAAWDPELDAILASLADLRPGAEAAMPVLLLGETGTGKTSLAGLVGEHVARKRPGAPFVAANCATFVGDLARSELFGHVRSAFTGAFEPRDGLLARADGGVLFLDEIGTLSLEVQAMLLKAIDEGEFYALGSDEPKMSSFQLVAATNEDLSAQVREGRFRQDLFARISTWRFRLPPLRERRQLIEPAARAELEVLRADTARRATFTPEAWQRYLEFAHSPAATWPQNFRDVQNSMRRLHTRAFALARIGQGREPGVVTPDLVDHEVAALCEAWSAVTSAREGRSALDELMRPDEIEAIDSFARIQLEHVIAVCRESASLADAGRQLFQHTRIRDDGTKPNDTDRLRKYLKRWGLDWKRLKTGRKPWPVSRRAAPTSAPEAPKGQRAPARVRG